MKNINMNIATQVTKLDEKTKIEQNEIRELRTCDRGVSCLDWYTGATNQWLLAG